MTKEGPVNHSAVNAPFARVLRIACRRWWALTGIIVTSLAIAVLWSANISAVLPTTLFVGRLQVLLCSV